VNRRAFHGLAVSAAAWAVAGCATPQPPAGAAPGTYWSGRLALQVPEQQSQSFSAGFELQGSASAGRLALLTPVGSTLAELAWQPGAATLRARGQTQQFASVDAVAAEVTGTAIPVTALFDWLSGINTPVPGWRADLSELGRGRLRAQRLAPAPGADLRIVLDAH